jgi:hypothetical protein
LDLHFWQSCCSRLTERNISTILSRNIALGVGLVLLASLYVYVLDTGFGSAAQAVPQSKLEVETVPTEKPKPVVDTPPQTLPVQGAIATPAAVPTVATNKQQLGVLSAAMVLNSETKDWLIGTLDTNPNVLVICFPKLLEQGVTMNRLAAYLEKASAPRDRLLNDAELKSFIAHAGDLPETFYLGHDYRMSDVARFFDRAQQQQLTLQAQERRLLVTLIEAGYLKNSAPYEVAEAADGAKALITVSQLTPTDLRLMNFAQNDKVLGAAILAHEMGHGEFLTREAYHQQSWSFWKSALTESERVKWKILLKGLDYDLSNEELLVNETQALLLHTPDTRVFNAAHLLISEQELSGQRIRFAQAGNSAHK